MVDHQRLKKVFTENIYRKVMMHDRCCCYLYFIVVCWIHGGRSAHHNYLPSRCHFIDSSWSLSELVMCNTQRIPSSSWSIGKHVCPLVLDFSRQRPILHPMQSSPEIRPSRRSIHVSWRTWWAKEKRHHVKVCRERRATMTTTRRRGQRHIDL